MSIKLDNQFRPQRILIVQFGSAKELVQTIPFINALRIRYPLAEIAWFCEAEMIELLNRYSIVDRIIIAKNDWYKRWSELKLVCRRLRAFAPDLCFDLQGTFLSGMIAKLSKCPKRIGFSKTNASFSNTFFSNIHVASSKEYEWERRLLLLEAVGIVGCSADYELPEISNEKRIFSEIACEFDLETTPYALIGASVQSTWPASRYAAVADHLCISHGIPVMITWQNEKDRRFAEEIVQESDDAVFLAPSLSFPQWVALARRASLYVGADTDFLYLATAAGVPTIGILESTSLQPNMSSIANSNYQSIKVQWQMPEKQSQRMLNLHVGGYSHDVVQVCDECDHLLRSPATAASKHKILKCVGA